MSLRYKPSLKKMEPPTDVVKLLARIVEVEDLAEVVDTRCTICMASFRIKEEIIYTQCRHIFHRKCVMTWFSEVSSPASLLPKLQEARRHPGRDRRTVPAVRPPTNTLGSKTTCTPSPRKPP